MFYKNLTALCAKNNTTPTAVIEALGLSRGSVTHWKNGKIPHDSTLIKIAVHFGVSVDDLLSDAKEKSPDESELDELDAYLAEIGIEIRAMDDNDRRELKNYVEFLVSKKKKG